MKLKTNRNLSLTFRQCLLISFLFMSFSTGNGGVIGNGKLIAYQDKVSAFEMSYPESWTRMQMGDSVSFVERADHPISSPCAVNVISQEIESVQSPEDLKRDLETDHPEANWSPIEMAGKPGFESVEDGKGSIRLFRGNGNVFLINYRCENNSKSVKETQMILESLKLK